MIELIRGLCLFGAIFMAYFLPTIVAHVKGHHNFKTIFILNLFLGWTALAWVVCLAMSFSKTDSPKFDHSVSGYFIAPFILIIGFFILPKSVPEKIITQEEIQDLLAKPLPPDIIDEKEKKTSEVEVKEKLPLLLKKFKKDVDKLKKYNFYTHYNTLERGTYTKRNSFSIYVGSSDNNNWLRFQALYNDSDWLFIESFIINIDDRNYTITPEKYKEIETEVHNGIQEEIMMGVSGELEEALRQVKVDKTIVVRYQGRRYYKDKTLSKGEKQAILDTFELYRLLELKRKYNIELK